MLLRIDRGQDRLAVVGRQDLDVARAVRRRRESLRLDLADCVGVALADRHPTDEIFTLDQLDFRVIVPLGRFTHFRLLPADEAQGV